MFGRTNTYTVHIKGDVPNGENVELVREGFSVFGFLFGPFWALYKRLWLVSATAFALQGSFTALASMLVISELAMNILQLCTYFILGIFGNDLIRMRLKNKGYEICDVVIAENETRAQLRFLDRVIV